jgi:hypothetical protein
MFRQPSVLLLALALSGFAAAPVAPQQAAPLADAAIEEFLRTARIVRTRDAGKGVTDSVRATLSDGTLTHDAHIQTVEEAKRVFTGGKTIEYDFRDSWRFNIAVYRVDRLLGLNLVPVSVPRIWRSRRAAFTWWADDVQMDEEQRMKKNLTAPNVACWNDQLRLVRVLDQLIDNSDRNLGNLLITNSWRLWAIDHTRAFRYSKAPRNAAILVAIDRTVLRQLETLDFPTLKREIGEYVTDADIRTLLSRRDGIVAHFQKRGDVALYDRQDPALGCLQ